MRFAPPPPYPYPPQTSPYAFLLIFTPTPLPPGSEAPPPPALVASVEMLIYGGLIASRCSNDTTADVEARVRWLSGLSTRFPGLRLYLSTVVMRIPSYNEDFEEPWFWGLYGQDLYEYSFYSARYRALGNASDAAAAAAYRARVPPAVVDKFLWRRARNHNATRLLLQLQAPVALGVGQTDAGRDIDRDTERHRGIPTAMGTATDTNTDTNSDTDRPTARDTATTTDRHTATGREAVATAGPVPALYITLDDSGTYGINVEEADALRKQASAEKLNNTLIYPGADEVGAALLARLAADDAPARPRVAVLWRAPNATGLVPNYENQPINLTVHAQLTACGAVVVAPGRSVS